LRTISDTIARLKAMQQNSLPATGIADKLGTLAAFGSNPGALRARTHIPEGLKPGSPLVVVLHGCTQTAAGYDHAAGWSHLADTYGFALLFPEQQRSNNPNLCFNWFDPDDIKREGGEALSIRQMIETLAAAHGIDRKRIYVTGLSAGGGMAAAMLATYPEVFAGGAIIAGLPYGTARTVPEAFDRMRGHGLPSEPELQALLRSASDHKGRRPTLSVWQGTADHTVSPVNADALVAQWRGVHALAKQPSRTEMVDGQQRRVWSDATGRECVESYTIAGMGHGVPLDTSRGDLAENAGPFMLDAGISSTAHIALFWGLVADFRGQRHGPERKAPSSRKVNGSKVDGKMPANVAAAREKPRRMTATKPDPAAVGLKGIAKTIDEALRKAGLLR
jgi:poly(hydroxyalkanoate) depolymerase family esterase